MMRRSVIRRTSLPPLPPETTLQDRIETLLQEQRLLRPYASKIGLEKIRARMNKITAQLAELRKVVRAEAAQQ